MSQSIVIWTELRVSVHRGLSNTTFLSLVWLEKIYVSQSSVVWAELHVILELASYSAASGSP